MWLSLALSVPLVAQEPGSWLALFQRAEQARAADDPEDTERWFRAAPEVDPKNATVAYHLAALHVRAGDTNDALTWLERAVDWGYADDAVIEWDEELAELRTEQRFRRVVEKSASNPSGASDIGVLWSLPRIWNRPEHAEALVARDERRAFVPAGQGILVWDLEARALVGVLDAPPESRRIALDPGGRVLAAVTGEARVQAWRVADRAPLWDVELPRAVKLRALHFSDGGTRVAVEVESGVYHLSLESGEVVEHELYIWRPGRFAEPGGEWAEVELSKRVCGQARSPVALDDGRVAVLTGRGELRLLAVDSARLLASRDLVSVSELTRCDEWLVADGRDRTAFVEFDDPLASWSVTGGASWPSEVVPRVLVAGERSARIHDLSRLGPGPALAIEGRISSASWSPDGGRVATGIGDRVIVWDSFTGASLSESEYPGREVQAVDFSPDGLWLAVGTVSSGRADLELRLHTTNLETGSRRSVIVPRGMWDASTIQEVLFLDGGAKLLTVLGGGIPDLDLRAVDSLVRLWRHDDFGGGPNWFEVELARSGRLYLSGCLSDCRVLDFSTGNALTHFDDEVTALVPGPDERRVFTIRDGALEVLDGRTFECLYTRVEYPDEGELIFLPTGWFRGTDEALASSWMIVDGRARLLVDCAKALYDPRRVAAGAAGVPVRRPTHR